MVEPRWLGKNVRNYLTIRCSRKTKPDMKTRMNNHQFGIQFVVFWPIYNLAIPIVSHVLSKYDISVNWAFVIFAFWGCGSRMLITKKRLVADICNCHMSIKTSESTSVQYFRYLCYIQGDTISQTQLRMRFSQKVIKVIQISKRFCKAVNMAILWCQNDYCKQKNKQAITMMRGESPPNTY